MGEPIRTRKGKLTGRGQLNAHLGRVVQVPKGVGKIRSFELSKKAIFFNYDETKSKKAKRRRQKRTEQKECTSRAERTI